MSGAIDVLTKWKAICKEHLQCGDCPLKQRELCEATPERFPDIPELVRAIKEVYSELQEDKLP